jgi:23S rRNA (guanosine2251-2'-O)-methyltransferase
MKVFGRNVLKELLSNPKDIKKIYLSKSLKDQDLVKAIKDLHLQYETVDNRVMDGMVEGNHQGVVVIINDYEYSDYHDMFNDQVVVMLDHLEDPHNFGAIIRTCEAAGIKSIIIPKDRSVDVNSTVMKTSAGALEYVNVAMVSNLNKVIDEFKNQGYFVYGAEADGTLYSKCNYSDKMVLVIGSEGNGLSRLVRENCDEIVSLPMNGHVNSLNASVAAAILIYDIIGR